MAHMNPTNPSATFATKSTVHHLPSRASLTSLYARTPVRSSGSGWYSCAKKRQAAPHRSPGVGVCVLISCYGAIPADPPSRNKQAASGRISA